MGWIEEFAKEEAERMARCEDEVAKAKTAAEKLQAANDFCIDITTPAEGLAAAHDAQMAYEKAQRLADANSLSQAAKASIAALESYNDKLSQVDAALNDFYGGIDAAAKSTQDKAQNPEDTPDSDYDANGIGPGNSGEGGSDCASQGGPDHT